MQPLVRRVAIVLSMLAALIVGATTLARADMMTQCSMMDESGGSDDIDCPMPCVAGACVSLPFAAPSLAASSIHQSLDRAERVELIYSSRVMGQEPSPPFHPPRI
jgi:hypothetical protein